MSTKSHYIFLYTLIGLMLCIAVVLTYPRSEHNSTDNSVAPVESEIVEEQDIQHKDKAISMLAFGDMMFDRGVRSRMADGVVPFRNIKSFVGSTTPDIITANLEGPIIETERTNCQAKAYSFQFSESIGKLLVENNFNVLNLANNHSNDCYRAGLTNTRNVLTSLGITSFGGGSDINQSYSVITIKEKNIAFVGIDITVHAIPIEQFYPLVQKLKSENDLVVVQIHWGDEYNLGFTSTQQLVGHKLIDSGSDIVIGHHPHVIEPIEIYKNKPIFYSLGNFIFDQIGVEENKGLSARITIDDGVTINLMPFDILRSEPTKFSDERTKIFCENYLNNMQQELVDGCTITIK